MEIVYEIDGYYSVKVRNLYDKEEGIAYSFPDKVVKNTIDIIHKSGLHAVVAPLTEADKYIFVDLRPGIEINGYDESECVLMISDIYIDDLLELISFVNSHPEAKGIHVNFFSLSELPEFSILLNDKALNMTELSPEIRLALEEFMRILIDQNISDVQRKIRDLIVEKAEFLDLLKLYSPQVQRFICSNVSKRIRYQFLSDFNDID